MTTWSKFGELVGWDGVHNVTIDMDGDYSEPPSNVVLECSCGARCYIDAGSPVDGVVVAADAHRHDTEETT